MIKKNYFDIDDIGNTIADELNEKYDFFDGIEEFGEGKVYNFNLKYKNMIPSNVL